MTSQIWDGSMLYKPREIKIYLKTQVAGNICEEKTKNKFYNTEELLHKCL